MTDRRASPSKLPATCPSCGKANDCHDCTTDPGATPEPGDVTLCWYCGQLGIYTEAGIRLPTDDELAELLSDQGVLDAIAAFTVTTLAGGTPLDMVTTAQHTRARRN